MKNARIKLEVNGRDIPLNPFVSSFLRQTILGMLSALKGIKKTRRIELTIGEKRPAQTFKKKKTKKSSS